MRLRRGSLADLDALEPLWVAVHHRHVRPMGNAGAIRLYERYGFAPTWTYLSRFGERGG